jgi:hypothetical protein
VLAEIGLGDSHAAQARFDVVENFARLSSDDLVRSLALEYVALLKLPDAALADAVHLALAVYNELDYLLT